MRKLVALIISTSLILVPCFAYADTASGSALTLDEQLWIMSEGGIQPVQVAALEAGTIKAAGDPGSSTNPYYFLSVGRNATLYYATNSTNSTSTSYYVDDLGDVVQGITQSIAYSTQNQRNLWSTIGTNTISAINDVWNRLGTLGGYVDGIESQMTTNNTRLGTIDTAVGNIKSKVDSIYTAVDNVVGYTDNIEPTLSSILSAIQNQSFTVPQSLLDDVDDINTNTAAAYPLSYTSSALAKYRQQYDGGSSLDANQTLSTRNAISNIWLYLANLNQSSVFAFRDLVGNVGSPAVLEWYDKDLNASNLGRYSFWRDFRVLGTNMNNILARLGFVLANDDEIAARQAAAANTAAAVSNVISSSGSGSAAPSDISGISNLKSSAVGSLSSGVSANTIFSETGSGGHAWDWFTQDIADELSAPSRRSNVRSNSKSSGSDTPMLDAYYNDLEKIIGFELPW